jgi:hypothetical protein
LLLSKIKQALDENRSTLPDLIRQFSERFPGSSRNATVEQWRTAHRNRQERDARDALRLISVTNAATLQSKGRAIAVFLERFDREVAPAEAAKMRRAAELAARFSQPSVYKAVIHRSGGLTVARYQRVEVSIDGALVRTFASPAPTTLANWDDQEIEFHWQAGQSVSVVLSSQSRTLLNYSFYPVARQVDIGPLALRALDGQVPATAEEGWADVFAEGRPILELALPEFKPDDWRAASDYLFPGDKW